MYNNTNTLGEIQTESLMRCDTKSKLFTVEVTRMVTQAMLAAQLDSEKVSIYIMLSSWQESSNNVHDSDMSDVDWTLN